MKTNENLQKIFKELYLLEKQARDLYSEYLAEISNEKASKIIMEIREEEEKHMEIAQKLIDITYEA